MTRIYCLTHGHTICCTCASSVLGTHGECSLTPKNGSSSPLFLTLVRKVDVILELVVNNMRKANVDMIRLAVPGENDLINAQFRSTPLLSNSEQVSTFLESLNSLLRSMGIGRSSFTYLRRKLLYCEEQFHMLPSLYHIEKPCNVNSSQVAKHIEFVGQGVRKATCGVKTKFYIKFLDEAGHRCHVATHNFRAEASMPDGLKFDVQVSQTKMPGVLEASYTCNQPGKLQLKLIQCFEQEKICCRVVTVKMNKFSRMEVKRHLCDDDFNNPWGICISVKGDIFVSDRCNHSIKVFGPNLTFKNSISEFGTENGKLNKPAGIAFDNNSDLVVCDKDNHRIQVFTAAGEFVRSSSRCDEAFLLQYPWGIAVNSQNKYIVSHSKFKISIMDSHFCGLMNIFAAPSQLIRPRSPRGICVDELDQIFFTDFENSEVFQTANEKHYYETFINTCDQRKFFDETQPRCQNVAIDSEGNFVITKSKINSVQFRSNAGAFQGELRIYGKPMTAIEMPGRAGYYMVTMVDSSYGLAIIGPRKIREMRRVSRLREYLNHSALS
ncbi:hypothetical protein HAZT_HAZT002869 [Hyalella azteca]|uniref:Uncharacterized protein n=1 Tax=Hyalella azteca TaxID=294128 RepID=A0A6A0GS12_HYAAZ|nr:hypothetical protein HAZT_HAZT002869 [Hyalella azteca]